MSMSEIIEDFMNPPEEFIPTKEQKECLMSVFDILKHGGTAIVKLQKGCIKVQEESVRERFLGKEKFKW